MRGDGEIFKIVKTREMFNKIKYLQATSPHPLPGESHRGST
jgi:hypothetical protein